MCTCVQDSNMRPVTSTIAFIGILLFPQFSAAYVIPHPQEREVRRNPRIEIIRNTQGQPIRSSRGVLLQRFLPNVPDDRLKKPSRRNIAQLRKARINKIRIEQANQYRDSTASPRQ